MVWGLIPILVPFEAIWNKFPGQRTNKKSPRTALYERGEVLPPYRGIEGDFRIGAFETPNGLRASKIESHNPCGCSSSLPAWQKTLIFSVMPSLTTFPTGYTFQSTSSTTYLGSNGSNFWMPGKFRCVGQRPA